METALRRTLQANAMTDGVHVRLMVTRGVKATVNQDPRNALGGPTVVITAEYKARAAAPPGGGLRLATASIRCTGRRMFDMRLNSHSRLNLITALIEGHSQRGRRGVDAGSARQGLHLQRHQLLFCRGR